MHRTAVEARESDAKDHPVALEMALRSGAVSHFDRMKILDRALAELPVQLAAGNHGELFADDTYARILYVPAGVSATGVHHKRRTLNVLLTGKVKVLTGQGDQIIEGPEVFVAEPGRKAVLAITDVLWMTVNAWDGPPDGELAMKELTCPA